MPRRWNMRSPDKLPLLAAALLLAAASTGGPVDLSQPWALPAAAGADTSVMMALHNEGDLPDALVRAACAGTDGAELVAPSGAGAPAQRLDQLPLAGGATVTMTPTSTHLVVQRLARALRVGDVLHCTATFAKSGERLFHAAVRNDAPPVMPPT